MKRVLLACLISAILGAVIAGWMRRPTSSQQLNAQEVTPPGATEPVLIDDLNVNRRLKTQPIGGLQPDASLPGLDEYTPEERINISVYEKTNRCVVHITTKVYSQDTFFSFEGPSDGAGSGSVIDKNGHILTNYHVIEGATEVKVTLFNGETFDAGLVGRDPANEVAVLRSSAPPELLFPIEFGDSSRLRVGQRVLAIGNPFGLERTLTVGTLSSLNRRLPSRDSRREIKSVIQIDAALNRGNSGGPLLNSRGQLIGMNTAIASQTGQNSGVGFAVPVNSIRRIVPQLIENGRVIRPVVGIESVYESEQGLQIIKVTPGGPAERAGLRGWRLARKRENRGLFTIEKETLDRSYADTIVAVDNRPIKTGDELLDLIDTKRPGDPIQLRVIRAGKEAEVTVVLGASE
jgi:S1-C subfamily serine protease